MKTLVLEPLGGVAGDMLLAALLHLGAPRAALDQGLGALGVPLSLEVRDVQVNGIGALHVEVRSEESGHVHRPWRAVRALLDRLPPRPRELAQRTFELLARAEGHIHGVPPDDVEFHEVGAHDSIADVAGTALLIDALGAARVLALPPPAGGGVGRSAHGQIPFPAPATLEVMRGRTLLPSGPGERTTPTGAALLAALTGEVRAFPELVVGAVGYGAGTKRWEDAPNLLRATLGETPERHRGEAAFVLEANLDDCSPQLLAVALEAALAAGALDAWVAPLTMKKGRPGHLLGALAGEAERAAVEEAILRETTTLGVRTTRVERAVLDRELVEVQTRFGPVRVKCGRRKGRLYNAAPELEDCRAAAARTGAAVKDVLAAALAAFWADAGRD